MRVITIACAFMFGFMSLGSVSAGDNKVDICHFQEESNSWKLLSVGQPAAGAHLEHHDDALPGGTTPQTGTVLDADCEEVEITCPCEGLSNQDESVTWDDSFNVIRCLTFTDEIGVSNGMLQLLIATGSGGSVPNICRISNLNSFIFDLDITVEEFDACENSIRQIAANDDVNCPE